MGKKKKVAGAAPKSTKASKASKTSKKQPARQALDRAAREERRARKMERRRRDKRLMTADMWAIPAPADLVGKGKLEKPKLKSKYYSYFEFAENTEKKDKKLEFQVCYLRRFALCFADFCNRSRMTRDRPQASSSSPSAIPRSQMRVRSFPELAMQ
jgi:hypothetical protein